MRSAEASATFQHAEPRAKHLLERVVETVRGGQHKQVRDVAEKPWPGSLVAGVALARAAREEVEGAVVVDRARVEDRPVAGDGARLDDGASRTRRTVTAPVLFEGRTI